MLPSSVRLLTFVNEILQSEGLYRPSTLPLKAPLWRKPKPPQRWWMNIINVVHLFTFYSAIWLKWGVNSKREMCLFWHSSSWEAPIWCSQHRGGHGDSCLTSPKSCSLVSKLNLKRGAEKISGSFSVFNSAFGRPRPRPSICRLDLIHNQNTVLLSGRINLPQTVCVIAEVRLYL